MNAPLRVEIHRLRHEVGLYRDTVSQLEAALVACYTDPDQLLKPEHWTEAGLAAIVCKQRLLAVNTIVEDLQLEGLQHIYGDPVTGGRTC